jgi:hypothetical protein
MPMEPFTRPIEHLEVFELWKQTFSPEDPDPEIYEDPEPNDEARNFEIACTFDYDLTDKDNVLFFCDVTIRLPGIAIQSTRCSFKVNIPDFPDVFTFDNLRYPVHTSIYYAFDGLKDNCEENKLPFPQDLDPYNPNVDDDMLETICNELISVFRYNRAPFDMENKKLWTHYGLTFTTGWETQSLMILTFSVIDQLIYKNTAYNRLHNRNIFFAEVPDMRYNSLRIKCGKIDKEDIKLTDLESVFFLKCVTCSVHILLSDKSDPLQLTLKQWGITKEMMDSFYKMATKLHKIYHKPYVEKFLNSPKPDWETLIR